MHLKGEISYVMYNENTMFIASEILKIVLFISPKMRQMPFLDKYVCHDT